MAGKTLKKLVRARMVLTGERYTVALQALKNGGSPIPKVVLVGYSKDGEVRDDRQDYESGGAGEVRSSDLGRVSEWHQEER